MKYGLFLKIGSTKFRINQPLYTVEDWEDYIFRMGWRREYFDIKRVD